MMRLALSLALLVWAIPSLAQDTDVRCLGGIFTVNDKKLCVIDAEFEDFYRTGDNQRKPAPGSLIVMQHEPRRPNFKFSGHVMHTFTMDTLFTPEAYATENVTNRPFTGSSTASNGSDSTGWGASMQWSPNGIVWIEAGWLHPPTTTMTIDSRITRGFLIYPCRDRELCFDALSLTRANRHRFNADDFTVALKGDITPDSDYFSVLGGIGVHRRYLRFTSDITTSQFVGDTSTFTETLHTVERSEQTRVFGQLELEIYPAGKKNFVGVGIIARYMSDGDREVQHTTSTLLHKEVPMAVQTGGWYVGSTLVLHF